MNDDSYLFEMCMTLFPRGDSATQYEIVGYRYGDETLLGKASSFGAAERLRVFWQAQKLPG